MTTYLIAYDLIKEKEGTHDYEPLWAELKRLNCLKTEYSLWLGNLSGTAAEVDTHFKQYMDADDLIWVTKLRKGEYDYRAKNGTTEWLKKNQAA